MDEHSELTQEVDRLLALIRSYEAELTQLREIAEAAQLVVDAQNKPQGRIGERAGGRIAPYGDWRVDKLATALARRWVGRS